MRLQKAIVLLISLLFTFTGIATSNELQTNPSQTKRWTLEACIQHAMENNISLQRLRLLEEEAAIQQNTARSSRMPNLNIQVRQEMNFSRMEDLIGDFQNFNALSTNANAISVIPLFTGFRIPNQIEHTRLERLVSTQNLEKAKMDLSLHITALFLQVLFFRELHTITEVQLQLGKDQLERTRFLIQAGNIPASHQCDIEAQIAKDRVAVLDAKNNMELALLALAQSLELDRTVDFDIYVPDLVDNLLNNSQIILPLYGSETDKMTIALMGRWLPDPNAVFENALTINPAIRGQQYRIESMKRVVQIAQAGYLPTLDFTVGIGSRYQRTFRPTDLINPITQQPVNLNPSFSEQVRNHGAQFVGLHLTIPILNRNQVRNQVRSAQLDVLNQQLILEENKKNLFHEIQIAHKNATAARERYHATNLVIKSVNKSFEHVRRRYEIGGVTVFEFNEARSRLIQSLSEQTQAKFEYILRSQIVNFYDGLPIRL